MRFLAVVFVVVLAVAFMAACAPMQIPPDPIVITKEVDRIVQVKCADKRPPAPDYPDTDERLQQIMEGDIFGLAQAYRAGKTLRVQRERENEAQISACVGE